MRVIAIRDVNHAPQGYYPSVRRHGLYEASAPQAGTGLRYFLAMDPAVSKTWLTDREAGRLISAGTYVAVAR